MPALDLGIPAALATGAAALAAAQAGVAAVQAATPRSTVQQLQDSGIIGQRVRRLSNTARRAAMSVISVQQQWLINRGPTPCAGDIVMSPLTTSGQLKIATPQHS